ncbi:hypothetical protein MHYP_G00243970 [Metynnis hypsauchen]
MDWRIILAVLCLIEGCALQNTTTTSPSPSPPTSDNGTQPSPSPSVSGTQPSPSSPVSGTQPSSSPPISGTQPSPSPPVSGTQPSPSPSGNGTQPSPSGNGTQPSPSPSGNGTQPSPSPSGNGTQPSPSGNGTQPSPSPSGNGTQPSPSPSPSSNGAATTTASLSLPFFPMSFSSPDTFTPDLDNSSSATYKSRAESVKTALEFYLKKLPNFLKLIVLRFRSGSVITDTQVVFNTSGTLPDPANITSAVRDAASNASSGLNITAGSINVSTAVIPTQASPDTTTPSVSAASTQASSNATSASASNATLASPSNATTASPSNATTASPSNATTASPSNATTASTSNAATASTSNATTASTSNVTAASTSNATAALTSNATTSTSTTAAAVAARFNVSFSISDTFNSDLSNSSSDQFKARSNNITSQLQPFFMKAFKNFIRMFIWRFRSGSIVVDSTLEFSSSASIPNGTQLNSTLVDAIRNGNLTFTVDPNSISVTQTLGSSTGSSMAPRMVGSLPLLSMSLISLLLSVPLHF